MPIDFILVPVSICGLLCMNKILKCISLPESYNNISLSVWIFSFISSFIAPIINISSNIWTSYLYPEPVDWLPYATIVSFVYLIGLIIYERVLSKPLNIKEFKTIWIPRKNAFKILIALMTVSLAAQVYVYASFGGILGYMMAYTDSESSINSAFSGMGAFFILSELFPYLFLIAIVLKLNNKNLSMFKQLLLIFILFCVVMFFGGLRGSRSNTVLFMTMSLIALHRFVFKLSKVHLVLLVIGFFSFMYIGRIYKNSGMNMIKNGQIESLEKKKNTNFVEEVIIGDLSRYSINAYELYRLEGNTNYKYRYGQTYLWGTLTFIPFGNRLIKAMNIDSRSDATNHLFLTEKNSRILGVYGEWLINFGKYTFFIPYLLLAFVLLGIKKYTLKIPKEDIRQILIPVIFVFIPQLLISDSSNIMFFFIKRIFLVWLALYLISNKSKRQN